MIKLFGSVIAAAVISVVTATYLQDTLLRQENAAQNDQSEQAFSASTRQTQDNSRSKAPPIGRVARLKMDARGHFMTEARMNGRRIEVLVDTGATSVAINARTARRLGINLSASDFKYTVNTANGQTKAARAIIDRVQIGRVTVRDVQAAVLDEKSLKGTLLGMSFLKQLREFKIENGELLMRQ